MMSSEVEVDDGSGKRISFLVPGKVNVYHKKRQVHKLNKCISPVRSIFFRLIEDLKGQIHDVGAVS